MGVKFPEKSIILYVTLEWPLISETCCINEYLSDLVLARNCCLARMLPGEAENGVGINMSVGEGKKCEAL